MQIRSLLVLLLILTISSCEKSVYISIPEESSKPVLNLLLNKDSAMLARVTFSTRLNGNPYVPEAKNAIVNLYENGTFKETLSPYVTAGRTYYRGNTLPKAGAIYRVTAAIPGYEEVSGSDQIPDTVKTGEMKVTLTQNNGWGGQATVNVQLHDDPAVQNFYRIRLYLIHEWVDANGNHGWQKIPQYFEGEEADLELINDVVRTDFYVTDALFNGRSPRFSFKANTGGDFQRMIVEISSLTYHSYNYLHSAFMAMEKNDDGLSEKVVVYNNIVNGLGIIGGVAQREYELVR
jgi:hypothetical protein